MVYKSFTTYLMYGTRLAKTKVRTNLTQERIMKLYILFTIMTIFCISCSESKVKAPGAKGDVTNNEYNNEYNYTHHNHNAVNIQCNNTDGYGYYETAAQLKEAIDRRNEIACVVLDDDYFYLGFGPCIYCFTIPMVIIDN